MKALRGNWTDGECFYVDAIDGDRYVLLAGPFRTLPEAEARLDEARELAVNSSDPKAWFYLYGCCKRRNGYREGKFNAKLGL